ncbi:MAG: CoA transferase, partial [Gammaproteobacteria bacterium]|nr:CoA transferase [Gammaproteobacteria bacterium]
YDTYETSDGKFISVGSIEPQFYALLLEKAGLDTDEFSPQMDQSRWPEYKDKVSEVFKSRTRDEWCDLMEGSDVCFAPVLSLSEVHEHPHNKSRNTFVELAGLMQPAPAPRFSRTSAELSHGAREPGEDTRAVLAELGYSSGETDSLFKAGVVA